MRKLPQRLLTRPSYQGNTLLCLCIAPVQLGSLHFHLGQRIHSRFLRNKHSDAESPKCRLLSRGFHGATDSKEEYRDASLKDWKRHLQTFEQYHHQSDLGQPANEGPRLLDQPAYNTDFDLWLELIIFRRRQDDIKSLQDLYTQIVRRKLHIPTIGGPADGLWENFLYLGWKTDTVWNTVIPYAQRVQARTGCSWPHIYHRILSHTLKYAPQHGDLWHARLRGKFHPSSADLKDIFTKTVSNASALRTFKHMYMDFSVGDMYSTIIPQLCYEENFKKAIKWHNLLMSMNDIPPDSKLPKPLFHYLASYGTTYQLLRMRKFMVKAGVPVTKSTNPSLGSNQAISREFLNRELRKTYKIAPKPFTDEFCGRLIATPAIPIEVLINGLRMFGVDAIGPISLRELALREHTSRKHSSSILLSQRLDQLREAGISIGDSTFCTVVSNLAVQGDDLLLEEVAKCNMHPDAFEDQDLQESLLATYHAQSDHRQANRTLAILTAKCKPEDLQSTRLNLLIQSAARRHDIKNIYQLLDIMQEKMVPVNTKSRSALWEGLLSPSSPSTVPATVAELPMVIAIFQRILRTGGYVNISQWSELLRRLGMAGRLVALERLVLWLADWYSNPLFRASQSSFFNQKSEQIPEDVYFANIKHPLRALLPEAALQAMVAWGFQHTGDFGNTLGRNRNRGLTWRWGIELLRELKQRNVFILDGTFARVCTLRLTALFGKGVSRRPINHRSCPSDMDQIEYMALEMERIWGSEVFNAYYKFPQGDPGRLALLRKQVLGIPIEIDPIELLRPPPERSDLAKKRKKIGNIGSFFIADIFSFSYRYLRDERGILKMIPKTIPKTRAFNPETFLIFRTHTIGAKRGCSITT